MTNTRVFIPENRLKSVLNDARGQTAATLSAASEALLADMAGALRGQLKGQVARLVALRAAGDAAMMSRTLELADIAMSIVEIAGAAGRPQLGEAARGILAMGDGLADAKPAYQDALIVHTGAVILLSAEPPPSRNDGDAVLKQLSDMRRFLGVTE